MNKKERIIGIIPARYDSTRFPGKPLAKILNKPMIQWVYESAGKSKLLDDLYVATDDKRIYDVVKGFGGNVLITSKKHKSGTDRIGEAVRNISGSIIANIQGDEPLISAKDIDRAITSLIKNNTIKVATLATRFSKINDLYDENKVKVVFDKNFNALYFSRSIIPFRKEYVEFIRKTNEWKTNKSNEDVFLKNYYLHIGLYVYRRDFLVKFIRTKQSKLEKIEKLEQLRILENGEKIKVVVTQNNSISVDTPEDIKMILKKLKDK